MSQYKGAPGKYLEKNQLEIDRKLFTYDKSEVKLSERKLSQMKDTDLLRHRK